MRPFGFNKAAASATVFRVSIQENNIVELVIDEGILRVPY